MATITEKFQKLGVDNAPGQEVNQQATLLDLRGEPLGGVMVDFSHGDVDAHQPIPGSLDTFIDGFNQGAAQAYTEYKGAISIREDLAKKLETYTGSQVESSNLIITPGTQGALFLALGSMVTAGDKVAIVVPDYFANRKIVEFFDGELYPIPMDYLLDDSKSGIDLDKLEDAFKDGVKVFLFSNPNNPVGVIYSKEEVEKIAKLADKYGVSLIVDELYSRQIFDNNSYTHLCATGIMDPDKVITIIGPSKTESLSGFRLGVAFGSKSIIARMEKLQAIVSLRAAGYSQAVLKDWFNEPEGWMAERISNHQQIRDELVALWRTVEGGDIRVTQAGSYIFPKLPELDISLNDFVKVLRVHGNIIVTPGTEFGPSYNHSVRLNFSQDKEASIAAVKRMIELVERYRKR